ncbi:MAG: spore coat associated protein CotJA [Faecalibacterium sp.]|nr:spore coat associated protein CotJA [Ruminococcus sp.]MCM1486581.1 spore coat associated protein CotJA [Faecalibacterium sp.]
MNNYRNTYGYPQQNTSGRCTDNRCKATSKLPENPVVTMAYVPYQECNDIYPCEKALCSGTVFPVLDKPLLVGCCR